MRKLFLITLPALLVGLTLAALATEIYVRSTWDPRKGTPGFFLSDAIRGQRLAPHYDGWFAGVPVRTNALGMRAAREVPAQKSPRTFRILVLGDSVTFGHGSVHTYPDLLQGLLARWRPDVDWEVWNAGVPGYNTSQELAHLRDLGPVVDPDLVIVGFFDNDLSGNAALGEPSALALFVSRVASWAKRTFYSYELYKRVYLQLAWQFSRADALQRRIEHLGTESALLATREAAARRPEQQLTEYERLTPAQVDAVRCESGERPEPGLLEAVQGDAGWPAFVNAVRGFQALHRAGDYRIVFFLNVVPPACPDGDVFHDDGARRLNDLLLGVMGEGTPAVSAFDHFLARRPSQMPDASAHAIGNANMTKAEALFDFLSSRVLPPLLPASGRSAAATDPTP